jgi:tetratricopeptide (TPR) repeat protein
VAQGFDWNSVGSEHASTRAIALDPGNAEAHLFRGIHLVNRGRLVEAVSELTVARTLDPLSAPVRMQLGRAYITARRSDDAVASLRIAVELNPEFAAAYLHLGDALLQQRRTDDALAAFRRAAALNGGRDSAELAYGLAAAGERRAARAILAALLAPSRHRYLPPVPVARAFAGLGDKESAFHWLEQAVDQRAAQARGINAMAAFDFLHADPRWAFLLRRLRLPVSNLPGRRASWRPIARPRPAPPWARVSLASTCTNG